MTQAEDPETVLAELKPAAARAPTVARVDRNIDVHVLEGYARAQLDALRTVITRLPVNTSNEYETYIRSVLTQCATAELLAADSWRVARNAGADPRGPLLDSLRELEQIRTDLLARLPASLAARFERACRRSGLPERVIATMLGVETDQVWDIRTSGVTPAGAADRVHQFIDLHARPDDD
ncbi:hypothetical protein MBRU_10010 [Mycolicibacterium brumae DSM 44177]|nr:hypothetical protein MBRU_10010 [Mycolicibacterium brumae DSM 44177]